MTSSLLAPAPQVLTKPPWARRHPVVVDANALIEDVLWRAHTGFSSLTFLGEQQLVAVVAPAHVDTEVREHLPMVVARTGRCSVELAVEVFETVHLPLIRFVDLPEEPPPDARVAGVALRDADDAPLAHLATLLAPSVVLTRDRHLTLEGFGQMDWLTTILLLRRLVELDTILWGGSRLVWLSLYLPVLGVGGLARRMARSEVALGLTLGLVVGVALWFRPQLRAAAATAWGRVEPVLAEIAEGAADALEERARTDEALQARLVRPVLPPNAESAAARILVERGEAISSKAIHDDLLCQGFDLTLATARLMLRTHASFVGTPGRGFELGQVRPPQWLHPTAD